MSELPEFSGDHELVPALQRIVKCIKERTALRPANGTLANYAYGFRLETKAVPEAAASKSKATWRP